MFWKSFLLAWLSKLHSKCPKERLEEVFVFEGTLFFTVLENNENFSRLFVGRFLTRLSKPHSTCSLEQFRDEFFQWNLFKFSFSRTLTENAASLWQNFLGLLAILFRQVWNCFLLILKNRLSECLFSRKDFFNRFRHWLEKNCASVDYFWTWFSKLISMWTEKNIERKRNFSEKNFLILCESWAKIFRLLVGRIFDVIFKNAFYESRETLSG